MGCNTSQEQRVANDNNDNDNGNTIDESGFQDYDDNHSASTEKIEKIIKGNDIINAKANTLDEFDEEADLAAKKIQAVYRGHKVRNTMNKSNNVNDISSSNINLKKSNKIPESNKKTIDKKTKEEEKEKTKKQQQEKEQKQKDDLIDLNLDDKELAEAALKIQSTFRTHLQHKQKQQQQQQQQKQTEKQKNQKNHDKTIDIEKIKKEVAEELDIDLNDPELVKAATKIQASFRGYKIRKDVVT